MPQTDTDYFAYLGRLMDVAAADVKYVQDKDASYGGSWKKSGGRTAWHMLRRKMDRLLAMMAPPKDTFGFSVVDLDDALATHPDEVTLSTEVVKFLRDSHLSEDVFAKIVEQPSGADGTVLAEIRDLRRYLLLVEADMVAKGVVVLASVAPAARSAFAETNVPSNLRVRMVPEPGIVPPIWPGTPEDGGHHDV